MKRIKIPDSVAGLLASDDVTEAVNLFRNIDILEAIGVVTIAINADGQITIRTGGLTTYEAVGILVAGQNFILSGENNDDEEDEI
jgi:hypothetical protein